MDPNMERRYNPYGCLSEGYHPDDRSADATARVAWSRTKRPP